MAGLAPVEVNSAFQVTSIFASNVINALPDRGANTGLKVEAFDYLSRYPTYLLFNGALFFIGMCFEKLISRFEFLRFLRGWLLVTLRKP